MLALAGLGVWLFWPGPDLRRGSVEVGDAVDVASRRPASYRIDYRVESRAGGTLVVSTERVWVRRPFEARVEVRAGGRRLSLTVHSLGRLKLDRATFGVAPAPASPDRRPDAYLLDAVEAGYAEARESRRVAGRTCRIFRTWGPASGPLEKVGTAAPEHRDQCFDEAGLLVEDVTFDDGALVNRRVAMRVTEAPPVDDELFETGEPSAPVRQGGGSARKLRAGSRPPGAFWEVPRAPDAFEYQGRYTVIPPQTGFDDPVERGRVVAFTSDIWVDGADAIVLEQGASLSGPAPFARAPQGIDLRFGELGRGQLVYNPTSAEVRVLLGGGRFVRVFGTVRPSVLIDVARSLEEVEGGEIVFEDDA